MRVAVVTGSNQGIGLSIVRELCSKFDGLVYLTSRNEERGKQAVEELTKEGLNPRYHQLDINDELSVIRLRDYLVSNYGGLDVLVNNAAILIPFKEKDTVEDFGQQAETTLKTNFFSTYRTCMIILPILKPHARVVNISSMLGHLKQLKGQNEVVVKLRKKLSSSDLSYEELNSLMQNFVDSAKNGDHTNYGWPEPSLYTTYIVSKIGVSAMSRIMQRGFDSDSREDLIVNHVHPGYVSTNMTRYMGHLKPEEGAAAPSWLALLPPNVVGPKGAFVWYDRQIMDWVNGPVPGID